jgi:outer membrane protein TolC
MFVLPRFHSLILLLLGLLLSCATLLPSHAVSPAPKATIHTTAADNTAKNLLNTQIKPLKLPSLATAQSLSLDGLLETVLAHSPELSLKQEKINESSIRFRKVASKRLLFFFKYLNASYLESSAQQDIQANESQFLQAQNQVLLQAGESYYQLAKAYLARYIYFQSIQQGLLQLKVNQGEFQIGESTSFDGLETENELITRYQQYLASTQQVALANQAISSWMQTSITQTPTNQTFWKPSDVVVQLPTTNTSTVHQQDLTTIPTLKLLNWVNPTWQEADVIALAHRFRADVQEAEHRIASSRSLIKAAAFDFNKAQGELLVSALKQLELKTQVLHQQLEWEVTQAFRAFELAQTQLALGETQLNLAKQYANQRQLSARAGFASNKDVLQAQIQLAQAHVKQLDATVDYNLRALRLLYSMGLLTHWKTLPQLEE